MEGMETTFCLGKSMETWGHGDMETWRHGDMEAWGHGGVEASNGED